ncbi:nucleotidyltransferase [Legionella beliardensis]|uniref:Nucleotidyltransferase n=1 Tax=Legionella beliardensis TaxID=91822 RepID=A0A378I4T4_9GAMM|nr:phosphoribosyl-dephospho-CoA transferase MdcG domain-containing protein [Legionella beliardensis]STX29760.1 nucleotidyltransferase [Legionella beliardensis]
MSYQRHTLCYLQPDTQSIVSIAPQENNLLQYWLLQGFPLIYTYQPPHLKPDQVQLAIPYFKIATQEKIRMSFVFSHLSIIQSKPLPSLNEVFPSLNFKSTIAMRVYGSFCWQHLTQQPYVRPSSDLDIQILYSSESLIELNHLHSILRQCLQIPAIDGEIRFPNFGDCSWLELIESSAGENILFKSTQQIYLLPREKLYAAFPTLLA